MRPAAAAIMKAAQAEQVQEELDEFKRFPFGSRPRGVALGRLLAHAGVVRGVCTSEDGSFAVSAGEDGTACVWDAVGLAALRGFAGLPPRAQASIERAARHPLARYAPAWSSAAATGRISESARPQFTCLSPC